MLAEFVGKHTDRTACTCSKCLVKGADAPMQGHTADMFFFSVCAKDNPDVVTFKSLIPPELLDGAEHSYLEIGGLVGDQGLGLQMMGLGEILGLWKVLHPVNTLGLDRQHPLAQRMAGMGMISIVPVSKDAPVS